MSAETPVGSGSIDAYRQEADRFCAALDEELYLHYSGQKPELELAPIYDRYADLFSLPTCRELGETVRAIRVVARRSGLSRRFSRLIRYLERL